ncbi:MAG: IS21 family transposase, partial [Candidatus Cloacimonadaceae bacterium]
GVAQFEATQKAMEATHGVAQFEATQKAMEATHEAPFAEDIFSSQSAPDRPVGDSPLAAPQKEPVVDGRSACAAHAEFILSCASQGLSGRRIYQDLQDERGFTGSYASVKRFLRRNRPARRPVPYRRLLKEPGHEMQVDYGQGAWIVDASGKRRKTQLLCCVLSNSRRLYCEAYFRQDTESFIRGMENAFRYFGGVTRTIVLDNLKAGVISPCNYDPLLNPKCKEFADFHGTCLLPCRPGMARHKGRIENGVGYVQDNALKGRRFESLAKQNEFLRKWMVNVSDNRFHGTEKRHVRDMFELERPCLQPLPPTLFPCFTEERRKVHSDGHVEVRGAYYSVPPEYTSECVWVCFDNRIVRVLSLDLKEIALHPVQQKGRTSLLPGHVPAEKTYLPERGPGWLLQQLGRHIGMGAMAWGEMVVRERQAAAPKVLYGVLRLRQSHSAASLDFVCTLALSMNITGYRELKELAEKKRDTRQGTLNFRREGDLIRSLSEYDMKINSGEIFT